MLFLAQYNRITWYHGSTPEKKHSLDASNEAILMTVFCPAGPGAPFIPLCPCIPFGPFIPTIPWSPFGPAVPGGPLSPK